MFELKTLRIQYMNHTTRPPCRINYYIPPVPLSGCLLDFQLIASYSTVTPMKKVGIFHGLITAKTSAERNMKVLISPQLRTELTLKK